jgi:hypothetical protein
MKQKKKEFIEAQKNKIEVYKIPIEKVMNRKYIRFLFTDPTLEECNAILKKFKADEKKIKKENPIYRNTN